MQLNSLRIFCSCRLLYEQVRTLRMKPYFFSAVSYFQFMVSEARSHSPALREYISWDLIVVGYVLTAYNICHLNPSGKYMYHLL